jgi:MFS family permease
MLVKLNMSDASFNAEWGGWRYPFWISILLVIISIYIRLKMKESPMFSKLKDEGNISVNPLKESFRHKGNFKMVLLALFGAVMGQGVIWYTGQFYAQNFLETKCNIEFEQSRTIMLWAILFATPFFVFWGWLSDKIGRKWIMMAGMLLGVLLYRPIFKEFLRDTNINIVNLFSEGEGPKAITTKTQLNNKKDSLIIYTQPNLSLPEYGFISYNQVSTDTLFGNTKSYWEAVQKDRGCEGCPTKFEDIDKDWKLFKSGKTVYTYTNKKLSSALYWRFVALVFVMILFVTMVYGPIAAFLVEMFPTKIRYTSMSLPYHIGNGVFGGLVPFIGLLLTTTFPGDPLVGLWYPIGVAALCFVIGAIYLTNKIDRDVSD